MERLLFFVRGISLLQKFVPSDITLQNAPKEKSDSPAPGSINAGVYLVSQNLLASLRVEPLSLERAVLPALTLERRVKVFPTDAPFLDIGIPSDYAAAAGFFERLGNAPKSP